MSFDINQPLFDDEGYYLEEAVIAYQDALLQRFAQSPEGHALLQGAEVDWSELFLDVLLRRMGMPLRYLQADSLREIFYNIIPATVIIESEDAPDVIAEVKAFFEFIKREFALRNMDECLKVLNQKNIIRRFRQELENPDNHSPSKVILTQMLQAGVDLTDNTQVSDFVEVYNANIQEAMKPAPVTEKAQAQHKSAKTLIKTICSQHLNSEYHAMSLKLLDKLLFQYADRLQRGQAKSWAAAIVYTIGRINFLFDASQTPHMTAAELVQKFGISQATASKKSSELFDLFDLMPFDPDWTLPSRIDDNPFIWMVLVDGMMIDIRSAPRAMQVLAYEQGIIPYIPNDKG